MVRFKKSKLVALTLCLSFIGYYLFFKGVVRWKWNYDPKCYETDDIKPYLEGICEDYLNNKTGGTFCSQLCPSNYNFDSFWCPNTWWSEKSRVVFVRTGNRDVVLKSATKYNVHVYRGLSKAQSRIDKEFTDSTSHADIVALLANATSAVLFGSRRKSISADALARVVRECDYNSNGEIDVSEVRHCFGVVTSKEYLMWSTLVDLPVAPQIFGTCGPLYAMEVVDANWWGMYVISSTSWKRRAQLALSFLALVEVLESTSFGVVYICDAQKRNFGVKGSSTVYAIDLDTMLFEGELEASMQHQVLNEARCRRDSDCDDLVSCTTKCNSNTGLCEATLLSSNLDVICRHIFHSRVWHNPGLLDHPPDPKLSQLLVDTCNPALNAVRKSSSLVLSEPKLLQSVKVALRAFVEDSS